VRRPSAHYRAALRALLEVDHDWELGFASPPSGVPRVPTAGPPPTVEAIRVMAKSVNAMDRKLGGGALYSSVLAYLREQVAQALFAPHTGTHVYAAAASLTEIAGWMAHDSGRDVDARMHFEGAYRMSLAAGSAALAANMCASMAHLARQSGQIRDSLRLADVGLGHARETGGIAMVEARLHAMRGQALAAGGDGRGCIDELARAERALLGDNANEHVMWAAFFDEASLAAEIATALHLLGDLIGAERNAHQVIGLRQGDRVRARAFGCLNLASILLDSGRIEEAAALGREVSAVAPTVSSARVRARLGELALAIRVRPATAGTRAFLSDVAALEAGRSTEVTSVWPV
jgi:hypothetical protein